jgi:hypothetical protein
MYGITENIYYSQLSSVAIFLQPEPVSRRIIQRKDCVLSLPMCCLLAVFPSLPGVNEVRSYLACTIDATVLKQMLKKHDVRAWTGFMCLRTDSTGKFLLAREWSFRLDGSIDELSHKHVSNRAFLRIAVHNYCSWNGVVKQSRNVTKCGESVTLMRETCSILPWACCYGHKTFWRRLSFGSASIKQCKCFYKTRSTQAQRDKHWQTNILERRCLKCSHFACKTWSKNTIGVFWYALPCS